MIKLNQRKFSSNNKIIKESTSKIIVSGYIPNNVFLITLYRLDVV